MRALRLGLGLAVVLYGAASLGHAQTNAPQSRLMSMEDCIQLALEQNLDLRIERYSPELAAYNLKAAYGVYNPVFGSSGTHEHTESGETLYQGTFVRPGQVTDVNTIDSGFSGLLPWAMTYDLRGRVNDTDGKSYDFDTNTMSFISRPYSSTFGSVSLGVVQPLIKDFWINPTRLNITILKNRVKWSDLGLRLRIMDIVTQVEFAYYDLKASDENVKVQEHAVELAERLLAENRKRVEVGTLAPLDEKQSESQVATRKADLMTTLRNRAVFENVLKQLITDNFASLASVSIEPSDPLVAQLQLFSLQDSWSKGLNQRPDFLQRKLDVEQQGIRVKINRNELYPQLDARAGGGYAGSTDEYSGVFGDIAGRDQPFYYFGGTLRYPLGNQTARNNYKASKAEYEVTLLALKKLEQDIMIQIDNDIKLAQSNFERVIATRKAREYAEAALVAEQKKLESGKSTSFFVLSLQNDLTAARSDEIAARVQYVRSLARLAQDEGSTLQRRGINVQMK